MWSHSLHLKLLASLSLFGFFLCFNSYMIFIIAVVTLLIFLLFFIPLCSLNFYSSSNMFFVSYKNGFVHFLVIDVLYYIFYCSVGFHLYLWCDFQHLVQHLQQYSIPFFFFWIRYVPRDCLLAVSAVTKRINKNKRTKDSWVLFCSSAICKELVCPASSPRWLLDR